MLWNEGALILEWHAAFYLLLLIYSIIRLIILICIKSFFNAFAFASTPSDFSILASFPM